MTSVVPMGNVSPEECDFVKLTASESDTLGSVQLTIASNVSREALTMISSGQLVTTGLLVAVELNREKKIFNNHNSR